MRFNHYEIQEGCLVLLFGDEVVTRLPIQDNWGNGLLEMVRTRNSAEGVPRWRDGSFMTTQQATDEGFQKDNKVA